MLTLSKALETGRLSEFAAQAEAQGIGPADRAQFDSLLGAVTAPQQDCWDGKNLDSADHRAHMSNMKRDPNTGQMKCPATHPKVIPQLTLGVWYSVGPEGANTWELSSDTMADGGKMVAGSTFHADYFEGWDERVKLMWEDNCINLRLNCSGGDLGNGKQLKMFSGFSIKANPRLVPVPVRP